VPHEDLAPHEQPSEENDHGDRGSTDPPNTTAPLPRWWFHQSSLDERAARKGSSAVRVRDKHSCLRQRSGMTPERRRRGRMIADLDPDAYFEQRGYELRVEERNL